MYLKCGLNKNLRQLNNGYILNLKHYITNLDKLDLNLTLTPSYGKPQSEHFP